MGQEPAPGPAKIAARCPDCGQRYRLDGSCAGRQARCKTCGRTFTVQPLEVEPSPAADPRGQTLCAVCQCPLEQGGDVVTCPECSVPYHRECWEYNKGCAIYGCGQAPPTEHLEDIEIPVSFWGKEEKQCPLCRQTILAAAVRCRHCGATFASAAPEAAGQYRQRTQIEQSLPGVRRAGVWLLVFSMITCTAPVAAIVGAFWYLGNREKINALPALHAALCKIALAVAVGQTALVVLMGLLYAAFAD
jgi:hypothetical protein